MRSNCKCCGDRVHQIEPCANQRKLDKAIKVEDKETSAKKTKRKYKEARC